MSDILVRALTAKVILVCDKCATQWQSRLYEPTRDGDEVKAAAPAFNQGWTLYAARRGRRVYCPKCEPTTPMHLVYGSPGKGQP